MFVGHFAVGLAAKRATPKLPLAWLFIACQALDLLWPMLVLAGVEAVSVEPGITAFNPLRFDAYPWSHGLVMSALWSALFALGARLLGRPTRDGIVLGALVFSHWLLDLISHQPDLPIWFGDSQKLGLGLWQSVPATVAVELSMLAWGVWLFIRAAHPRDTRGRYGFWSLIAFLTIMYLASAFGPQAASDTPPEAIAGPALAMWLIVAWAAYVDRHWAAR
jgi:hypothetical protein